MIDNSDDIKKITGYAPGKLYECTQDFVKKGDNYNEIAKYKSNKKENGCTYDENSFNFHILPMEQKLFESISNEISQKRKDIFLSLKKSICKNSAVSILRSGERGNIYNLPGKTNDYFKNSGKLFSYIKIHYGGCNYYMMFVSFFKTNDRKIDSYLKKIQYIKESCDPGYPEITSEFNALGYGRIYSNPNISFYDDENDIANNFLDFMGFKKS